MPYKNPGDKNQWERKHREQRNPAAWIWVVI